MRHLLVFDVNETLLDVHALAPLFTRAFGDALALREWFSTLLLYSEVSTLAGPYADFAAIGGAALEMVASARGRTISTADRTAILGGMRTLPPYPEVADAIASLGARGFRMVALTNSPPAVAEAQLGHAELAPFFERIFSVDAVGRFKPAPEPYQHVARQMDLPTSALRMIAAHAWDIVGAMRAGCAGAFVARPGKVLYPLGPVPDVVGPDLRVVAKQIASIAQRV
jgi:2-haloacid dehalogenase